MKALGEAVARLLAPELRDDDGVTRGRVRAERALQGPPGGLHGGFVALLFDHVLGWHLARAGLAGLTGRLDVRYRRLTPLETDLDLEVRTLEARGRRVVACVELRHGGAISAEAQGLFVRRRRA